MVLSLHVRVGIIFNCISCIIKVEVDFKWRKYAAEKPISRLYNKIVFIKSVFIS